MAANATGASLPDVWFNCTGTHSKTTEVDSGMAAGVLTAICANSIIPIGLNLQKVYTSREATSENTRTTTATHRHHNARLLSRLLGGCSRLLSAAAI